MGQYGEVFRRAAGPTVVTAIVLGSVLWFGAAGYARDTVTRTAAGALAQYQYPTDRPGWGCGDKNHEHTGPPGAQYGSTPPPGCTQYHGPDDDQYSGTRPGWGCGDANHTHTGPPGAQYGKTPPPGCTQYRGR
jgi:hypothetical protein